MLPSGSSQLPGGRYEGVAVEMLVSTFKPYTVLQHQHNMRKAGSKGNGAGAGKGNRGTYSGSDSGSELSDSERTTSLSSRRGRGPGEVSGKRRLGMHAEHKADDNDDIGSATTTMCYRLTPAVPRQRDYIYIANNLARLYRMRG